MSQLLQILRHPLSGHSHRVELFCALAGLEYELVEIDLAGQEQKKSPFLELNAFAQIPVLRDGEIVVQDSNAILVYLARKYAPTWIPVHGVDEAQMQRFLSIAAGELVRGPATARVINVFKRKIDPTGPIEASHMILKKLEIHMSERSWFVGDARSLVDVALYTYIAHAPEGDVSLHDYPQLRAWLTRVEALDGFLPMKRSPVGLQTPQ